MLDVKKLLTKLLLRQELTTTETFTIPALSAGARGYWTIPVAFSGTATAVWFTSVSVSGLSGLQLTPIAANGTNVYIEYYSPNAITGDTYSINVKVKYLPFAE